MRKTVEAVPSMSPVFGSRKNDQEVAVTVHESVLGLLRQH